MRFTTRRDLLAGAVVVFCCVGLTAQSAQQTGSQRDSPAPRPLPSPELVLEVVPPSPPRAEYGATVPLLVEVKNVTKDDVAVCWSSATLARFFKLEVFTADGAPVSLKLLKGEVIKDYYFSGKRDIIILPANGLQLVDLDLNTRRLPRTGACTTYLVSARYVCRRGLETEWARSPGLCVGEYRSLRVQLQVDDRPLWKRILGLGACPPLPPATTRSPSYETPTPNTARSDAPPEPNENGVYRFVAGGRITEPRLLKHPPVEFGKLAGKRFMANAVVVETTIGEDGRVRHVKLLRGVDPEIDQAVLHSAKASLFEPAKLNGKPVAVKYVLTCRIEVW